MSVTPNPQLRDLMRRRHARLMAAAADEGADIVQANLSSGSHGEGVHYARLPNRSSAEGQMPVKQSGDLAAGVTSGQEPGETRASVIINDDLGKLLGLEFSPPSTNPNQPGTPQRHSGGRAPMWETFTDNRTVESMEAAMEDA